MQSIRNVSTLTAMEIVFSIVIFAIRDRFLSRCHREYKISKSLAKIKFLSCNYLDDKWIIRFEALDRLGGCINVMDKRKSATIETSIETCDTTFVS